MKKLFSGNMFSPGNSVQKQTIQAIQTLYLLTLQNINTANAVDLIYA